jgi:hypothetical protein
MRARPLSDRAWFRRQISSRDAIAIDLRAPSSGAVQWLATSSDGRWLTR